MGKEPTQNHVVRFGVFEADLRSGELRKSGVRVKLQEQPYQVLAELLRRPGEVVTRDELREKLWPADTFVDFDHSLGTAIKKIRQALGDSATNPRFVETLPKRGYRFIAPVGSREGVSAPPPVAPAPRGRKLVYLAAGTAFAALVAVLLFLDSGSDELPFNPENWQVVPFTSYPGSEISPSFSPDGEHIAFARNGEDRGDYDIYVKQVGSEKPVRLTSGPQDELAPAWSPDGRQIAFVRYDAEGKGSLNIMPSTGGSERALGGVATQLFRFSFWPPPSHLSWTPDSRGLILPDRNTSTGPSHLFYVSADTGERHQVTEGPPVGSDGDSHPSLSPDGRTLAFVRDRGVFLSDIHIISLSDQFKPLGKPRRLGPSKEYFYQPSWTSDGNTLLYGVFGLTELGTRARRVWSVSPTGLSTPNRLPLPGDHISRPIVSAEANRLAYVRTQENGAIWRLKIPSPVNKAKARLAALSSTQADWDPRYSPDGKWISFTSTRSGVPGIWIAGADGSDPRLLYAKEGQRPGSPRWSPDGERVVIDSRISEEDNHNSLFVINVHDGRAVRITTDRWDDAVASWSRDGRWIYFGSNRTGREETWKVSASGGQLVQITKKGGGPAMESPDGRVLYYVKEKAFRTSLWRVPLEGGEEELVLEPVMWWSFEPTENGIYYVEPPGRGFAIRYFDLGTRESKTMWRFPAGSAATVGLSIAPDETELLFTLRQAESDIWLVENFR